MTRWALAAVVVLASACSSGNSIVPAGFRGPVAVAPFRGWNPDAPPGTGIVPLLAVASVRGNELRLIDPNLDVPIRSPSPAWALAVPTLQRPTFLGSGSLRDGDQFADLLVVASTGTEVQLVGTWLTGLNGFGVVQAWDLASAAMGRIVPLGSQILSLAVAAVPGGSAVGSPPAAPPVAGRAWVVLGLSDPLDLTAGQLVVLEMARQNDGSIALAGPPVRKPLKFSPAALAAAPDNVHLYAATQDAMMSDAGEIVFGVAEIDVSGGLLASWPVRPLDARGAGTFTVAAAFVGERTQANYYTFAAPALRVYAALDPARCGREAPIDCGIATFDPARGGLAADPAVPWPDGRGVPTQSYRTPLYAPTLSTAMGIAIPPANPGTVAPGLVGGSQVCYSPAATGVVLPLCPTVTEITPNVPFNGSGASQRFMEVVTNVRQLWTSAVALVTAIDGLAYVQDLGRFGPTNEAAMLTDDFVRTQAFTATTIGPAGPTGGTAYLGYPNDTAALGLWLAGVVVRGTDTLPDAIDVWPGFTRDDHWLISYQGVLPGLGQRRGVLGLDATDGKTLYLAIQEAAVQPTSGVLKASGYWVKGAVVAAPSLGIHTGAKGDIGQFLLDNDPCTSKRPNWVPSGGPPAVYDSTQPPQPHEAVIQSLIDPADSLYPGGAMRLLPPVGNAALLAEYQCLVTWFQQPANAGKVLTAFGNIPVAPDYARGVWVRAGELLLAGAFTGYAGRPILDQRYELAWKVETGLDPEALLLARKARRFYYPASFPIQDYLNYTGLTDPMQPGPALGFRVGRFCSPGVTNCNATTSLPARDAGIDFFTRSGVVPTSRRPNSTSGGNAVNTFDMSTIVGQESWGRVFYGTFTGDVLLMVPPGLDQSQVITIR